MANKVKSFSTSSGAKFKKYSRPKKYNTQEWVEYRSKFLSVNSKCYCCGAKSNVVDHVVAWKGDEKLFYKEDNMIAMCDSCHSRVTQLFDKAGRDVQGKLHWISQMRLSTGTAVRSVVVPWDRASSDLSGDGNE